MEARTQNHYNEESEIQKLINAVNRNPISDMEMHAFLNKFYFVLEEPSFSIIHNTILNHYRHWSMDKSASLLMRINAISLMAEENLLRGHAEYVGSYLKISDVVFFAVAQCPVIERDGDIVFDAGVLLREIFSYRPNPTLSKASI